MTRFTSPLIVILLCGTALAGCASDGGIFGAPDSHKKAAAASDAPAKASEIANLPTDVEGGVRQAQEMRLAGHYDEAIHTLSQLMLVASDDPRVVGEYGKTLAEQGRAQEAVQFLTRATELQPSEWSFYSALGVSYDQLGNQSSARAAYEQALKLRPGEASILNNYALSRMMANDPQGARELMARAENAGGASDPKIARNIELVNKLAVAAPPLKGTTAADAPEPGPVSKPVPVSSQPLPAPSAQNTPHPASDVVMQPVPADPQAGPAKAATRTPAPLAAHAVKTEIPALKTDTTEKAVMATKAGTAKPDAKSAKADVKPAKPQTADAKPANADTKAVKAAEAKPDAKPQAKPAAGKGGIPELRQTASAY